MSQIIPVHLEPTMIKGVNQLVRERFLEVSLVVELILANENAIVGAKATRACIVTGIALYRFGGKSASSQLEMPQHKNDHWRRLYDIGLDSLASVPLLGEAIPFRLCIAYSSLLISQTQTSQPSK